MKRCPECGYLQNPDNKTCEHCGHQVDDGFIVTDASTGQKVKQLSDTQFIVIEGGEEFDIDIATFSVEDLEDAISGYYDSLAVLRKQYGDDSNMVIAEIIAETNAVPRFISRKAAKKD